MWSVFSLSNLLRVYIRRIILHNLPKYQPLYYDYFRIFAKLHSTVGAKAALQRLLARQY